MQNKYCAIIIFIFSFLHILFFTQSLPPFWEAYQTHEGMIQQSLALFLAQIFTFSGSILDKVWPAYGLYFKFLFSFFGYDFSGSFRIVKALIFSTAMLLVFYIFHHFLRSKKLALTGTVLIATSYPLYIHTMVFDEPFIIGETYKLAALFLFLITSQQEHITVIRQISVYLLAVLAFRTYPPAASLLPLLILTTLSFYRKQLKKYLVIFLLLFIMIFPFSSFITGKVSGPFGFHIENIPQLFTNDLVRNIVSPFSAFDLSEYSFRGLYWKPLPNLVTL